MNPIQFMVFQKQDLEGTHYRWAIENEKQIFTGQPSRRTFDRFNGDQVLFLINLYCAVANCLNVTEGRKIEHQIYNHLPLSPKSEISVFHWLLDGSFQNK